ncbi:UDP-4-amino-4,6-dideoxy-N-acetyl-beta-L-altrosamine N-acetyltransferase [Peribacillus muralis]|uniref:UDP-4-amino-4, 6-dideoxy-N-acetyl-beta-L-altrosamine N-acetyltransferase n=1 Tax=Peribacillus muralis TaxID=264697 RepID=UPI0009E74BB2|nr:UDP-4-amino-4,6-dideoxy-N-acetyl-beta-L-altrosamine N-acetyltransferase [Peribacillus muralis]
MDYCLRALSERDKDMIFKWRNYEHIRMNMYNDQPIAYVEHSRWFEDILKNQKEYYRLFIYRQKPLGLISFKNNNQQNHTCVWGFYIGENDAPKGSGTIMGWLGLDYAFHSLFMKKIIGEVLSFNKKSERYHLKLGFKQEGIYKNKHIKEDRFIDVIRFGLQKEEWEMHKGKLNLNFIVEE